MKTRTFFYVLVTIFFLAGSICCTRKKKSAGTDTVKTTESAKGTDATAGSENGEEGQESESQGVRSGIIEYIYTGDKSGKSIHYFDDYGMKSAVYSEIVEQGVKTSGWNVSIGEDQYMWDPSKPGEGTKSKNPIMKMMMEQSQEERESLTNSMYEQMGMVKGGTEIFQGKECTVFRGEKGRVMSWKGILMKMEVYMGIIVSRQEVTSIETNIPVDAKYFQIPDNVTFSEAPAF